MSPEASAPDTNRPRSGSTRRALLQRSAALVGGAALASLLEACMTAPAPPPAASRPEPIRIVVLDVGNIETPDAAPRKQVVTDFMASNPDVTVDVRSLPTNTEWDRVARTTVSAGEQVDLVNINGLWIRAWVHDRLLDDLSAYAQLAAPFGTVDPSMLAAQSDDPRHQFAMPLLHASPAHVTALFYNKTLLDKSGLQPPRTLADMKAMVQPLQAIGAVPLVHPSGDVAWNALLVTWIQPMLVNNQPMEFTQKTLRGEVQYNGPEWIETFETIANLTTDGVLGRGSGGLSVDAAYQLFHQGKTAMLYTGSWSLPELMKGMPAGGGVELHATSLPLVGAAQKAQPQIAFNSYAISAGSKNKDAAVRWLTYAADPAVDLQLTAKLQAFSPMPASNSVITDPIARELAQWFKDGVAPLDWFWEPEVTAEIRNQVQALVKGDVQPKAAGDAVQATADTLRREGRSYFK